MGALDNLALGNRRIMVNGVTADPARDVCEFVQAGATVADDPAHDKTVVTLPAVKPATPFVIDAPSPDDALNQVIAGLVAMGWFVDHRSP